MSNHPAERNFHASMRLLRRVEATCATLPALNELKTLSELTARARIVRSALNARALFENFSKHLAGLSEALADYETRKRMLSEGDAPAARCPAGPAPNSGEA